MNRTISLENYETLTDLTNLSPLYSINILRDNNKCKFYVAINKYSRGQYNKEVLFEIAL